MTTYIFLLLFIIIGLLMAILMRRPTVDISALREDNARLRERLAERLGALSQNAIELKNISGFDGQQTGTRNIWRTSTGRFSCRYYAT